MRKSVGLLGLVVALGAGCKIDEELGPVLNNALVTDSTEFQVTLTTRYEARIGWTFTNATRITLSMNHCNGPHPPTMQKLVDGQWVNVYPAYVLMCLSTPPFRLEPGESFRGTRFVSTGPLNTGTDPEVLADSIAGTYRLRWSLSVGPNPDASSAAPVEAISNEFRLRVP
jgi:hypothetical protein